MAHSIEVVRETAGEKAFILRRAFLFGLRFRQSVTRPDGELTRAVAVNWDADEESELDERMRADDYGRARLWQGLRCGRASLPTAVFFPKPFFTSRNLEILSKTSRSQNYMPEIEIEINAESGEMATEDKGIAGPLCEKTAEAIKQVFGKPARDEKTRDYHVQPQVKRQIKGK